MQIIAPQRFCLILKGKHLLLDTNVFIDAFLYPTDFARFFQKLKDNDTILVTIQPVLIEFLKGANTTQKFKEKRAFVEEIIDAYLPLSQEILDTTISLTEKYKEDGKSASITDLLLGGTIVHFKGNLFLLSKNTNDFPTTLFKLDSYLNLLKTRSIQSYGLYNYQEK